MKVMKFGGTSVGDATRINQLIDIVRLEKERDPNVVVVVSAMSGVTNLLLGAAHEAAKGNTAAIESAHNTLLAKHRTALSDLVESDIVREALDTELIRLLDRFAKLCEGIALLGELPPRALDFIAGTGERLSARLVAAALNAKGIHALAFDADKLVVTDDNFGEATPDLAATTVNSRSVLLPVLQHGTVPVVTGFIGATEAGIPTTLGRGGSDFSGGIFGAVLEADEVVIWTDADGFMTADPRLVPDARTLSEISYSEAAELAYYGAKVLHPKTLVPLIPKQIALYVKNSFKPDQPGTRITTKSGAWNADIKSVTSIKDVALVTVSGSGMMGLPGIAAKTFASVAALGVNVLMISQSSSENNLCLMVGSSEAEKTRAALTKALEVEFHHQCIDTIGVRDKVAIIAAVGEAMRGRPGIAGRVFTAVAECGANVVAIAQGSSELNISFVVDEGDAGKAVAAIHSRFELGK
jgi:bifunctional aspartokinase / homoserine dehydrogenase 1